jgi:uncharacterized phage protein (TIGR02218 family)
VSGTTVGIFTLGPPGSPSEGSADISLFITSYEKDAADEPADEKGVRITQSAVKAVAALDSDIRITQTAAYSVDALNDDIRVSQTAVLVMLGEQSLSIRTTQSGLLVLARGNPCLTRWTQIITITRRDGTVYRFTSLDIDLTYGGNTYVACGGLASSATENTSDLSQSGNVEIEILLNSNHISDQEVLSGLFDGAAVEIWSVPWAGDPDIPFRTMAGEMGEIKKGTAGFSVEIVTKASRLQQRNILDTYTSSCRHQLGDSRCGVDLVGLTVTGSVTQVTSPINPGQSRKRSFFDTSRAEADGYFNEGVLTWTTGNNAGTSQQVDTYTAANGIILWDTTAYRIEVGDEYSMTPGCDKTTATCQTKYSNYTNFGGFPHIPGIDGIKNFQVRKGTVR